MMKLLVLVFGWAVVLIGLDLSVLMFAFFMAFIDGMFGDKSGAAFWISFISYVPNPIRYLP
jgi:hypothetical protein